MAHLHRAGISGDVSNQNFRPELATWFHWFPLFTGLSYEVPLDTAELLNQPVGSILTAEPKCVVSGTRCCELIPDIGATCTETIPATG